MIQGLHISRSLMTSLAPTASPWKAFAISGTEVHGSARRSRSPEARLSGCCLRCATLLHCSQTLDRPLYPPPEASRTADAGNTVLHQNQVVLDLRKGLERHGYQFTMSWVLTVVVLQYLQHVCVIHGISVCYFHSGPPTPQVQTVNSTCLP